MKSKILLALFAVLTLSVGAMATVSSVAERTRKSVKKERTSPNRPTAKVDAEKLPTVYGWLRYVEHAPSDQQYGVCRFNAGNPATVDVLFPFDAEHQACAGAFANGIYYVYRYTPGDNATPVDFGTVNLTTGAFSKIADYSRLNALFADMTFDYSTQTMYAIANVGSSKVSTLITVDLANGDVHNVATLKEKFVTLACSYDGQLYAIKGDDGYLYKINKKNGEIESIGYTFEEPAEYFQSMEFDHSTETLYWAANTIYEEGFLTIVNTTSGNSERTGTISENAQVVGLHIPFARIADKAPAAVEGLTVTPAAEGALSATLSWTNPSLTYDKKNNTTITRVDIFRDNALVESVNSPTPGAQSTWTDANVPTSGRHEYKVLAVNDEGDGEPSVQTAYIGHDTPKAPTGAIVSKINETTLKVDWTAPTDGQNGGWVDQASLRYRVKRLTDNTMVAENLASTTYTDIVDKLNTYSYEIEAYTADGNGGKVTTNKVAAGPAITVPYNCSFATDGDFGLWTVIDANNDDYTWTRETTLAAAKYYANEDYETSADDWLISSPIALNAGVQYRLRFKAKSYDESYPEHVAVHLGKGKTVEAMTTKLNDFKVETYEMRQYEVTLPLIADDGNYNIGFHCHSQAPNGFILYITDVELSMMTTGNFKGTVTDGITPVENAKIYIDKLQRSTTTKADGTFDFGDIEAGEYEVRIQAEGYASKTIKVNIEAGKMNNVSINIQKLRHIDISGRLVSEDGNPIEGGVVTAEGYTITKTISATDGTFSLQQLPVIDKVSVNIHRYMTDDVVKKIDLTEANTIALGDVEMKAKRLSPAKVTVTSTNDVANVAWETPADFTEYRHDSGIYDGRLGNINGTKNSVYGAVYRTPAILSAMSWFTDKYLQEHKTVNIFVFDLDSNGNPTSTVLFSRENVANIDNEWNTFEFPTELTAPRGYMLAISADGHAGLGIAKASDEYPFAERENCYSDDYKSGNFTYIEEHNINRPLMIRATGVDIADAKLPLVTTPKYEVFRCAEADTDDPTKWVKLTAAPQQERTIADTQWATLPYGGYRYGVKAMYANNDVSDARLSAVAYCNMTLPLEVAISTSTPVNEADGATVALKGQMFGNEYNGTVDADGKLSISEIWRDVYSVMVSKAGFVTSSTNYDATTGETATINIVLNEYRVDPFGLEVSTTNTAGERKFVWNTPNYLFDDFEDHEAFAINSPGSIGWSYIDNSNTATIPIDGVNYPNSGAKMAFQVFNPYETDPVLAITNEGLRPHSGKQFIASFAKENSSIYNNDFIISPELSFANDFTFKFFAKSFNEDYGREKMNVGYSTTGKEAGNFTWLNGENPVELPMGKWTEYRYTVPAKAKYLAINCVSDYLLFMMVDDIFIGYELPDGVDPDNIRGDLKFEVFLDGNKVAEQAEHSFVFKNLQNGRHRAGVKALFHTDPSPLVETEFEVTDATGISDVANATNRVYPNPTKGILNIDGTYDRVDVYNLAGTLVARFDNGTTADITGNPDGVYIVRVVSEGNVTTAKVILKK